MSRNSVDRNLLIGALAVQLQLISPEQFVDAMNAWVIDKSASLDIILRKNAAIDDDTRGLLLGLADKHIGLHSGSASESLASLAQTVQLPETLAQLPDAELSNTLNTLFNNETSADPMVTLDPMLTTDSPPAKRTAFTGMRFRFLRAHSAGGLGTVSVARDEELGREVAFKEIKEAFADHPESRRRFLIEGEITGCLEHPGIVPVYGLGEHADGRPFYAMRFIRGESLRHAIKRFHNDKELDSNHRQRELEMRKLLRRLIDVCNAIEYAHSRGVLHRDLKPDNIMLGKYGETLVVDWGLAKAEGKVETRTWNEPRLRLLSGGGSSGTQMGDCLGTPAYMSPEQASGRLDLMRATSDVYSLGATLYAVLIGQAPFAGRDVQMVLKQVRTGDFRRPRECDPRISSSLEAVCLKAMALDPDDRYPTAADFATDIERWLSDEPVTACIEPITKRVARWSRRHRVLVSSLVAGSLASVLILSFSLIFLLAANRRERTARDLASSERDRAETNLSVAKQAVSTMLTEVGREELAQVPQMEQIRTKLLTKARTFYEGFLQQRPTDETLRFEWAIALRNLAEIDRLVDNYEQAEKHYSQAIEELKSLAILRPTKTIYRQQMASVLDDIGQLVKSRDAARAESFFDEAIELQQQLATPGANPALLQETARSFYNRGLVRAEQGNLDSASSDVNSAIETLQSIFDDPASTSLSVAQELARCYNNLANISKAIGDPGKARQEFATAIDLLNDQVMAQPNNRDLVNELAIFQNNFANLLRSEGNLEQAARMSSQAVEKLESLARPLPALANELANALHSRGVISSQQQMPEVANTQYQEAQAILKRLTSEFPMVSLYHDRLGNASFQLGTMRFQEGNFVEAIVQIREAMQEHKEALDQSPGEPNFQQHLKNDFVGLSLIYLAQDQTTLALETSLALAKQFPDDGDSQFDAAQLIARCIPQNDEERSPDDGKRTQPQADPEDVRSTRVTHVIELLRNARKCRFGDNEKIDKSLQPSGAFYSLKSEPAVAKILEQLKSDQER